MIAINKILLVLVAVVAVAMAGHGSHGPQLPFLANLTAEQQKAFEDVFHNQNLTISEIDTQVAALAKEYKVSDILTEFQAKQTAHEAELKKNATSVISNLSSISSKLDAIFLNKDQTFKQQRDAVDALRKEHSTEVDAVNFINSRLGGHRRGHHGGHHGHKSHGKQEEKKEVKKTDKSA